MKIRSVGKIGTGKKSIAKKGMSEYNKKIVDELLPKKKEEGHFTEVDIMSGERWEGKPVDEEAVSVTPEKEDLELTQLEQFYGTTQYYNVMGTRVTDGVKYVMDNGYSWLVTDALAVLRTHPKVRGQEFVVVKMVNEANGGCSVRYEDGNGNVLYKQKYDITDAKVDVKMYFENGVLLLPRER